MIICPICRADTSRTLEEHTRERHPIIRIDRHSFQLVSKNYSDSYLLIKINNINEHISFTVYRSNSHGGIFRLCTRTAEGSGHLYKGEIDYVTQTFIHMELQKFIVQNYRNLIVDDTLNVISCPAKTSKVGPADDFYDNYISVYDRRVKNELLDKLVGIDCGVGFASITSLLENVLKMHDLPSNFRLIQKRILSIINPAYNLDTLSIRPSASPLVAEYMRTNPSVEIKKRILRVYLEYISIYLTNKYDILEGTNKLLFEDTYTIPKIDGLEIRMKYYSIVIRNKKNPMQTLTVIYAIYNIISDRYKQLEGRYSIVFNIIPHQNEIISAPLNKNYINRIGLYRYFMSVGIYLCKIFDYAEQVRTIADKTYGGYVFLGDLYSNLFPVDKLYSGSTSK